MAGKKFKRVRGDQLDNEIAAEAYLKQIDRGRKENERLINLVSEVVECGSMTIGAAIIESYVQERTALIGSKARKAAEKR